MIAVPFFIFLSLSPHHRPLLFTVFLFKFKNNRSCLFPPVFVSFRPLLDGGRPSLSLFTFLIFSLFPFRPRLHFLRSFEPRRPSLCNIINTAKFTSVYIHHAREEARNRALSHEHGSIG